MRVKTVTKALVYKVTKNEFENDKGKFWYSAIIEQDGDVCTLGCTEAAAELLKLMTEYRLDCQYDSERKKLRIVGIITPVK